MLSHPLFSHNPVAGEWALGVVLAAAQVAAVDLVAHQTQACQAHQWDNKQECQAMLVIPLIYRAVLQVPLQKAKRNINLPIKQARRAEVDQDRALLTVELRARWVPPVGRQAEVAGLLGQALRVELMEIVWGAAALLEDLLNKGLIF